MKPTRDTHCACGARYGDMRTGLDFAAVQQTMKTHVVGEYRQLRRRSVLGFWRELKLAQWAVEHGRCDDR